MIQLGAINPSFCPSSMINYSYLKCDLTNSDQDCFRCMRSAICNHPQLTTLDTDDQIHVCILACVLKIQIINVYGVYCEILFAIFN